MEENNENPYASSRVDVKWEKNERSRGLSDLPSLRVTFWKWTLICVVSAAPSFFVGLQVCRNQLAIPAMLLGIILFILGYTHVVRQPWSRELMARRPLGACIGIAFGLRVTVSILFPMGLWNDVMVGMASVFTVEHIIGNTGAMQPLPVLATTIVQGILLNVELFLVAFIFLGVSRMFRWAATGE